MNKKVYIKQDGNIPGHRIIEELQRRGAEFDDWDFEQAGSVFFIDKKSMINFQCGECLDKYTELLYNKEEDTFYEKCSMCDFEKSEYNKMAFEQIKKTYCSDYTNDKGCINCKNGDMKETYWGEKAPSAQEAAKTNETLLPDKFIGVDAAKEGEDVAVLTISEGYEATIEDGKIIVRKKRWQPKEGDEVWYVVFVDYDLGFVCKSIRADKGYVTDFEDFQTEKEAQAFCDRLNNAIKPIFEERRKEAEK